MSTELLYTSAPQGLRHGSRGFCTVLTTAGMPINVIARLEAISSYRHLFKDGSERESQNPVSYAHQRLNLGGQIASVISRVAAYGTDYTGRTNKIAHHVTIDPGEMPAAGPAWLMRQRSVLRSDWLGQCETPASGPAIPRGDQPPRICTTWKTIAGDAGWGGVVAEAVLSGSAEPLWVIYPLEYQDRLLEMMDEAISLLPASQRWQATFNTFAANIPPDVQCKVRFVPVGTEEARFAKSDGKAIDLTKHQSITTASQWVERARGVIRGEAPAQVSAGTFNAVQEPVEQPMQSAWSSDDEPTGPPPPTGPPELPPELTSGKETRKQLLIVLIVFAAIVGLGSTWTAARMMSGLPILPGGEPAAEPYVPEIVPDPEPQTPKVVQEKPAPKKPLDLVLHYDKKQIQAWALEKPESDAPLPRAVSLRGFARIEPLGKKTDQSKHGIESAKLISWAGETKSLHESEELRVVTTRLSDGAQTLSVQKLPYAPADLGPTELYCSRETGDLIAMAEVDWGENPEFLAEQAVAYRDYVVLLAETAGRLDAAEMESEQLPEVLKDAVSSFIRTTFPGRQESRIATMIRKGSGLDLAEQASKLSETLQTKMEQSTKRLTKEQQAALIRLVSDCERISRSATELRRAFEVLKEGQVVEVPELKFLESEKVVARRIPIRFHYSW